MGLDSVELIMEVEKYFAISIPDREAEKVTTVGRLVDCIGNILSISHYDFDLRERTFLKVKNQLFQINPKQKDFRMTDMVADTINVGDKQMILELENSIGLTLPGFNKDQSSHSGLGAKIKKWFSFVEKIDFQTIRWKNYLDIILAANLEKAIDPKKMKSKYEIYLAVMRITVDKIGVGYEEIGVEKSFTDDLGVD